VVFGFGTIILFSLNEDDGIPNGISRYFFRLEKDSPCFVKVWVTSGLATMMGKGLESEGRGRKSHVFITQEKAHIEV